MARPTTTPSAAAADQRPFLDAAFYWRFNAFALTGVALLGIVLTAMDHPGLFGSRVLAFDWPHNLLHVVLAGVAFLFGFAALPRRLVRSLAIVFGFAYGGLGLFGFFVPTLGAMHLEVTEDLLHLALGAWGLVVGFGSKARDAPHRVR